MKPIEEQERHLPEITVRVLRKALEVMEEKHEQ